MRNKRPPPSACPRLVATSDAEGEEEEGGDGKEAKTEEEKDFILDKDRPWHRSYWLSPRHHLALQQGGEGPAKDREKGEREGWRAGGMSGSLLPEGGGAGVLGGGRDGGRGAGMAEG